MASPTTAPSRVGPKGRTVIPAAVRRAAGLNEGDEVVTSAVGEGRVLLETVSAVRNRVWDAAPAGAETADTAADVRAARVEDVELSDAAAARRAADAQASSVEASQARGQALLAELGLA
jgi:AbrB family looped-hinge helix DNA binding protein